MDVQGNILPTLTRNRRIAIERKLKELIATCHQTIQKYDHGSDEEQVHDKNSKKIQKCSYFLTSENTWFRDITKRKGIKLRNPKPKRKIY